MPYLLCRESCIPGGAALPFTAAPAVPCGSTAMRPVACSTIAGGAGADKDDADADMDGACSGATVGADEDCAGADMEGAWLGADSLSAKLTESMCALAGPGARPAP